jgi:DNA-binding transcriptional regulator PaaX
VSKVSTDGAAGALQWTVTVIVFLQVLGVLEEQLMIAVFRMQSDAS